MKASRLSTEPTPEERRKASLGRAPIPPRRGGFAGPVRPVYDRNRAKAELRRETR